MRQFSFFLLALLTLPAVLHAQQIDTIRPNPAGTVELREVWRLRGAFAGASAGSAIAALGDITGDSINDFAVRISGEQHGLWNVYAGGRDSISQTPLWQIDSTSGRIEDLVIGDFYSDGRRAIGFTRDSCPEIGGPCQFRLDLFWLENGVIPDTNFERVAIWRFCPRQALAVDLDEDGDDELILLRDCEIPEIWIYRGGPEFRTDTPTVVLRDTAGPGVSGWVEIAVADFSGDTHPDLLLATEGGERANRLIFWFSETANAPWNWSTPDRSVTLAPVAGMPELGYDLPVMDVDGDAVADIGLAGSTSTTFLYRSRNTGKSPHSRSFTLQDADNAFYANAFRIQMSAGPMNDASGRYPLALFAGNFNGNGDPGMIALEGGPAGPDATFEAWHSNSLGFVNGIGTPLGDVTGDGWSDVIVANSGWFGNSTGIALVLAGGSYIPTDPAAGVEWFPIAGERHEQSLAVWPQPARDLLHIAWRGDLRRSPHHFQIHDASGRLIATGSVPSSSQSEMLWNCSAHPAGLYLLSVFDHDDHLLATTSLRLH